MQHATTWYERLVMSPFICQSHPSTRVAMMLKMTGVIKVYQDKDRHDMRTLRMMIKVLMIRMLRLVVAV